MNLRTAADDALEALVRGYDGPRPGTVDVWWAALTQLRPTHVNLLDGHERTRADAYVRRGDRDRFVLGGALLRAVCGTALGLHPREVGLDRRCDDCGGQHGRPVVLDAPWSVSVSHSGPHVAVAVATVDVGVDVEWTGAPPPDVETLRATVLAPSELARVRVGDPWTELLRQWVAKESVLKATGHGLRTPMRCVVVPARGAGPVQVPGRRTGTTWSSEVPAPPGSVAAVATLGPTPVQVLTHR